MAVEKTPKTNVIAVDDAWCEFFASATPSNGRWIGTNASNTCACRHLSDSLVPDTRKAVGAAISRLCIDLIR